MSRFLTSRLESLTPYVPGEQPKNMAQLIKLNTNENPYPPSPKVVEAVSAQEVEKLRLYSDPDCRELTAAIAAFEGLESADVFAGNGSDEILAFCFQGFTPRGAAFADLTYGFYRVYADFYGVAARIVPLREDMSIAAEDYDGLSETVFIANPNAPTGICLPTEDIERLLRQDVSRLVVVDEAYVEFGGVSAKRLLDKYDNLLVVRTFSKSRQLAGARLGYALGSKELIADLNRMKFSFNPYNINRLTSIAGVASIADGDYYAEAIEKVVAAREYTAAGLEKLGFTVLPSKANFIFAGKNARLGARDYFSRLRENGILVRYFDIPRADEYVRITIGTPEQMETLLRVTEKLIGEAEA